MLSHVHVKNLALIDEVEMHFNDHLNILSGETGAGKSVLMGAVNMALGAKVSKDMIRQGADFALAELTFINKDARVNALLDQLEIPNDDEAIVISRRITTGRSVCRVNGEMVTAAALKQLGTMLMDIHGQHDHQSLLDKSKHLVILDRFIREPLKDKKEAMQAAWANYTKLRENYEKKQVNGDERERRIAFIEFEVNEINEARLMPGEDEQLEADYRKMSHGRQLIEAVSEAHERTGYDNDDAAGEQIGRALRALAAVEDYDADISPLADQLAEIENLLNDFNRELSGYLDGISFDEEDFRATEERLDLVNRMKSRYGGSIEAVLERRDAMEEELAHLKSYDEWLLKLKADMAKSEKVLKQLSEEVSEIRKAHALVLEKQIAESLKDLNFMQVAFKIDVRRKDHYSAQGIDEVEFMVSTNPGEQIRPLAKVASGGELSRIMLGIKAILANIDDIPTLIFDEIDTGISGRTAQKVAQKMSVIAKNHQVLCITHLAQIAAMADSHYLIEKTENDGRAITGIYELDHENCVKELARLMGGVEITEGIMESAAEMKALADQYKAGA